MTELEREQRHRLEALALVAQNMPIAMFASVLNGDRDGFLALGFDAYESKPIDIARLDRLLARYLGPAGGDKGA